MSNIIVIMIIMMKTRMMMINMNARYVYDDTNNADADYEDFVDSDDSN